MFAKIFNDFGPGASGTQLLDEIEKDFGEPIDANKLIWFLLSYFPDAGIVAVKRVVRYRFILKQADGVDKAMAALWSTIQKAEGLAVVDRSE